MFDLYFAECYHQYVADHPEGQEKLSQVRRQEGYRATIIARIRGPYDISVRLYRGYLAVS